MVVSKEVQGRRALQWVLAPVVILVIALGWKYPFLGFFVPLTMLMGMAGGFVKGRYVCGHLCPRGAFFDRVLSLASPGRPIPKGFRDMRLRWTIFAALIGFMVYRISLNPGSVEHWGRVFWLMCVITTGVGVAIGLFVHPRSWCAFCPIGTFQNAVGGHKSPVAIDSGLCRDCGRCEAACPIGIPVMEYKSSEKILHRDCLKCPECAVHCPAKAITLR
jgi:polyferredoxin